MSVLFDGNHNIKILLNRNLSNVPECTSIVKPVCTEQLKVNFMPCLFFYVRV